VTNFAIFLLAIAGGIVSGLAIPAGVLYFWRSIRRPSLKDYGLIRKIYYVVKSLLKALGVLFAVMLVGSIPLFLVPLFSGAPSDPIGKYLDVSGITSAITVSVVLWGDLIFLLGRWLIRRARRSFDHA
jgi:hypothetical protein